MLSNQSSSRRERLGEKVCQLLSRKKFRKTCRILRNPPEEKFVRLWKKRNYSSSWSSQEEKLFILLVGAERKFHNVEARESLSGCGKVRNQLSTLQKKVCQVVAEKKFVRICGAYTEKSARLKRKKIYSSSREKVCQVVEKKKSLERNVCWVVAKEKLFILLEKKFVKIVKLSLKRNYSSPWRKSL